MNIKAKKQDEENDNDIKGNEEISKEEEEENDNEENESISNNKDEEEINKLLQEKLKLLGQNLPQTSHPVPNPQPQQSTQSLPYQIPPQINYQQPPMPQFYPYQPYPFNYYMQQPIPPQPQPQIIQSSSNNPNIEQELMM